MGIGLSEEQISHFNFLTHEKAKEEFDRFKKFLENGKCYLCEQPFDYFSDNQPCIHWLLRPKGFEKNHFKLVYEKYSYWNIQPYLRWLANSEIMFGNINNLIEEKDSSKIIENTIKYKDYEWSFSCSANDLSGHIESDFGKFPHYHFQMKIDSRPFIDYSDFHIPFTDYDKWIMAMENGDVPEFKHVQRFGAGMEDILSSLNSKNAMDGMKSASNEKEAVFKLDTFVIAEKGYTISGDEIAQIVEESKKTGVPLAKLVGKLKNVSVKTIIQPGPGVPKIAGRTKRKSR